MELECGKDRIIDTILNLNHDGNLLRWDTCRARG